MAACSNLPQTTGRVIKSVASFHLGSLIQRSHNSAIRVRRTEIIVRVKAKDNSYIMYIPLCQSLNGYKRYSLPICWGPNTVAEVLTVK